MIYDTIQTIQELIATSNNLCQWAQLSSDQECWVATRQHWHPVAACHGNCAQHPLMRAEYRLSPADQAEIYEAERAAAETVAEREARAAAAAAERAALALDGEAIRRERYARDIKERTSMGLRKGEAPKKLGQPCKWVIGQFKGDECWAHEYTCPKTGKRIAPHTCNRVHPGQVGWHNEWFTNRFWTPPAPETRSFSGLAAAQQPAKRPASKIAALEDLSAW